MSNVKIVFPPRISYEILYIRGHFNPYPIVCSLIMELFRWERIARKACMYNETDLPDSAPQAVPLQVHMYL